MGAARAVLRLRIPSRIEAVVGAVDAVVTHRANASADAATRTAIGLHEVLNNIVEHGYAGRSGGGIEIGLTQAGEDAWVEILDDGRPHPSHDADRPPEPSPVDDLMAMRTRGRGLWLISQCFAEVRYDRAEGRNRTRLKLLR